jgi:indolepyruvate ferredoxin oxidoreductase, alpha subunit
MPTVKELLLSREPSAGIMIGNTAVVRGMIESGTRVVTAYPGSPTPEIASAIGTMPAAERPFYFEFSTNEKVATEVALGASINGHLTCVFFKSVGLNVAADSFVQLAHMNVIGGMVIIIGDDPGANSSQNEQDNRHYARLSYIPLFEPGSAQESYEMYKEAARLSQETGRPVILRMTTHVCHAKERVSFTGWEQVAPDDGPKFDVANGPYVPIASLVFPLKAKALANREAVRKYANESLLNRYIDNRNPVRGIISAGLPARSVQDVLEGVPNAPDILALGIVYPLPTNKIAAFLRGHQEVKIIEELDDFMEQEIKAVAYDRSIRSRIVGKTSQDDWMGEYTPARVANLLRKTWPDLAISEDPAPVQVVTPRPPQMCPGCGHRTAFHAAQLALGADDITVGDIGCHTLGFIEPYEVGQVLLSMGHSMGTAAGMRLFNESRKVLAFIGDSTLFHAGVPGIVNAVFNRHNLTLIVMDNGTTAMTGHQGHPASGNNFNGETNAIDIESMLRGLGVSSIKKTDAYAVKRLVPMIQEALEEEEVSVIIAAHPCMLKQVRELRRAGTFKDKMVDVDQSKCSVAYTCVSEFACPTFQIDDEGKVTTHPDLCIGDASCLQTCASRAITAPRPRQQEEDRS